MIQHIVSYIYWDPRLEMFRIPWLDWPILWYGFFFALGFVLGFPLFVQQLQREGMGKKEAVSFADRLALYVILGTVLGARLGHLLFYEKPESYLQDPMSLLRVWEGGLASHGGVVGVFFALFLFWKKYRKEYPNFSVLRILDLFVLPAALIGALIRVGNFFNQEVLGAPTSVPWAVIFGHPFDGSSPVPRHPAQLYEALFYFGLFLFFWAKRKASFMLGRRFGLFVMLVFSFRVWVETIKPEQSALLMGQGGWTMGQLLSIPLIALGAFFLFRKRERFSLKQ